jgi:hypothetical protein
VYLLRMPTGWQIVGREGGADGRELAYYFDEEDEARQMVQRMLATVPAELSNWAKMTLAPRR